MTRSNRLLLAALTATCLTGAAALSDDGPIPRTGKPGAGAYDGVPEPRRSLFVRQWKDEVNKTETKLQTAEKAVADSTETFSGAKEARDVAAADAERWEKKYKFDTQRQYRVNQLKAEAKKKMADYAMAKASAGRAAGEVNLAEARTRLKVLEENDPPFNLAEELGKAEAARRAEEETDFGGGLILMKKTLTNDRQIASGTILNRSGRDLRFVRMKMNLHDKDGAQVGSAVASTTDLEAGGKWAFKARMIATAPVASCKVYEIIGENTR